jgi:hypothetical protein
MSEIPESLRLYQLCKATKFAALPWAGGMYDQHPDLIEEWTVIIDAEIKAQNREMDQQRRQARARTARRR